MDPLHWRSSDLDSSPSVFTTSRVVRAWQFSDEGPLISISHNLVLYPSFEPAVILRHVAIALAGRCIRPISMLAHMVREELLTIPHGLLG